MRAASAMFNTVYEAEWTVHSLRGADMQRISIVARSTSKREVFVDDLITRKRLPFDTTAEQIRVTDRMPQEFLDALAKAGLPEKGVDWYRRWLDDGYVLVIAYVEDEQWEDARELLRKHGGIPYGATPDDVDVFSRSEPPAPETVGEEFPVEGRWRRPIRGEGEG